MKPMNTLVIMADEHHRDLLGCAGHPLVKTPHLDALAARGTRFTNTYTPSPICVPARSAFATGKDVHQIDAWCNALAYDGAPESWHHRLRAAGHHVRSIGKLHFRGAETDDAGFSESEIPMNIVGGVGDALGLLRDRSESRGAADKMVRLAGPGESVYTAYDREISLRSQDWLRSQAPSLGDQPWTLFVSFVSPHFPLTAPQEFYDLYDHVRIAMPRRYAEAERPRHPYLEDYRSAFAYDTHFKSEADVKRALAGYMGLVSFIDAQVGALMAAVSEAGLLESTRVIYTSDHGDNMGARGLWGKSNMYEDSVAVPLIVAGPDVAQGQIEPTPKSLTDVSRYIAQAGGASGVGFGERDLFSKDATPVLSQYHATGSRSAAYMIRMGRWKYMHYALYPAQLFDLETDPFEQVDLADDPTFAEDLARCHAALLAKLDPDLTHQAALAAQAKRAEELGGAQAIIARGDFGFSPPPGVKATFS